MEGPIFGGASVRREVCVSKSIGLACSWEGNLPFLLCFYFVFEGKFQVQAPLPRGGLYSEGRFNGGFLRYDFWGHVFGGAYTWRAYFRNFTVFHPQTQKLVPSCTA